jgi:hypothetical protein
VPQVGADVGHLASVLRKPLRPLWLSPDSRVWLNHVPALGELPFTPLFLVSASQPRRCRVMLGGPPAPGCPIQQLGIRQEGGIQRWLATFSCDALPHIRPKLLRGCRRLRRV